MRVQGQGPLGAQLMLVGEGPGTLESQTGIPFHPKAPAGAELSRYFNGLRLPHRDQCWVTNLVKEWEGGSLKKKQEVTPQDIERDEWELIGEIETAKPQLIVGLGRHSTSWLLQKSIEMGAVHGLLFHVDHSQANWSGYVLPCYHPAAGLHQPDLAACTAYDLDQLAGILKRPQGEWEALCWTAGQLGTYTQIQEGEPFAETVPGEVGMDTEGVPTAPWGVSIAPQPGRGFVLRSLGLALTGHTFPLPTVFHNYIWDQQILETQGIWIQEDRFHDTMLMAYLLGVEPQALKDLALRHLGLDLPEYKDVVGHWVQELTKAGKPKKKQTWVLGTLDDVPKQVAIDYAGADADVTLRLKPILWQKIQAAGLETIYEIDRRMLPVYARMETIGLPVSLDHFAEFGRYLAEELEIRTFILQAEFGDSFNPGSPDQVAAVLFGHLQIPGAKKTPSGKRLSTNDKILQSLKAHPAVQSIIEWREIQKLKGTFVDSLPGYCRPATDGSGVRLHYRLLPTRVVSGRLAAKDPNVLGLPKHSDLGRRFRAGIQTIPGRCLGSWDLNQIELRVLALDSGSAFLRDVFGAEQDLHARTAERIFGVPAAQQDGSLHRLPAKAVNFGIPMGMTEVGLAEQMRKNGYPWPEMTPGHKVFYNQTELQRDQEEICRSWIQATIADWGIGPYLEEKKAQARRYGYVTDRWGRRRYLPSVLSPNKHIREEALRMAQSFPIQAGARGFYKTIVARVWREVIKPLRAEGHYLEPLLDIHDDLLLEFDEQMADWLVPLISSYFDTTFQEAIPITCKAKTGQNWSLL